MQWVYALVAQEEQVFGEWEGEKERERGKEDVEIQMNQTQGQVVLAQHFCDPIWPDKN